MVCAFIQRSKAMSARIISAATTAALAASLRNGEPSDVVRYLTCYQKAPEVL